MASLLAVVNVVVGDVVVTLIPVVVVIGSLDEVVKMDSVVVPSVAFVVIIVEPVVVVPVVVLPVTVMPAVVVTMLITCFWDHC